MNPKINTKTVPFRKIRFDTIDVLIEEIDRIVSAEEAGTLETLGNWSIGQIFSHLAAWIEYGYVGYPMGSPPWILKFVLKFMVRSYLKKGMPRGIRIPGTKDGTYGMDPAPIHQSAERLKNALLRLKQGEPCPFDSPAFGPMGHQERIQLNLRHAELHLGYLRY